MPLLNEQNANVLLTLARRRKFVGFFFALVFLFGGVLLWLETRDRSSENKFSPATSFEEATSTASLLLASTSTNALVTRVVDGDTLVVKTDSGEELKVRLLGVNAPESVDPRRPVECFGKEASRFLAQLVEGKRVRLEEDMEADNIDKYGRALRNIILEDGQDLNGLLVEKGYAYAYTSFPLKKSRKSDLQRWQRFAKEEEKGLWNPRTCAGLR